MADVKVELYVDMEIVDSYFSPSVPRVGEHVICSDGPYVVQNVVWDHPEEHTIAYVYLDKQ